MTMAAHIYINMESHIYEARKDYRNQRKDMETEIKMYLTTSHHLPVLMYNSHTYVRARGYTCVSFSQKKLICKFYFM